MAHEQRGRRQNARPGLDWGLGPEYPEQGWLNKGLLAGGSALFHARWPADLPAVPADLEEGQDLTLEKKVCPPCLGGLATQPIVLLSTFVLSSSSTVHRHHEWKRGRARAPAPTLWLPTGCLSRMPLSHLMRNWTLSQLYTHLIIVLVLPSARVLIGMSWGTPLILCRSQGTLFLQRFHHQFSK